MAKSLENRYEFVYFFDVENGNPNGDPDAGNMPRIDPETNHGIVTDVCLKRKVRNYFQILCKDGCDIFVKQRIPLNPRIAEACEANKLETYQKKDGKWDTDKAKGRSQNEINVIQKWLCKKYYDIRAFGGVLSTGPNAGQIRGPIQFGFAKSIDPIIPLEVTITRVTDVDKEEGEMGRKHVVPYGLYRAEGYVSPFFAQHTEFTEDDLSLFWEALKNMFEHDHSAARGKMSARKLFVFKHKTALGNAPAHQLFSSVEVKRDEKRLGKDEPARQFDHYNVIHHKDKMPGNVEVIEML
jgi:CRISPR-associated protein Csd2